MNEPCSNNGFPCRPFHCRPYCPLGHPYFHPLETLQSSHWIHHNDTCYGAYTQPPDPALSSSSSWHAWPICAIAIAFPLHPSPARLLHRQHRQSRQWAVRHLDRGLMEDSLNLDSHYPEDGKLDESLDGEDSAMMDDHLVLEEHGGVDDTGGHWGATPHWMSLAPPDEVEPLWTGGACGHEGQLLDDLEEASHLEDWHREDCPNQYTEMDSIPHCRYCDHHYSSTVPPVPCGTIHPTMARRQT
mmetsp:Transcript_8266/g.18516  ORF Transcript_8266/g.18516 Transcript_8266/m.18516 type:complete len:243 (+) Transcript_8266:299-1027(+)